MKWRLEILALLVLMVPLQACDLDVATMRLQLADFDSSGVECISLWKLDPQTGSYDLVQDIPFQLVGDGSSDLLSYPVQVPGATPVSWVTALERSPTDGELVTFQLLVGRPEPGSYKISARNDSGDSPLSSGVFVVGPTG